MHGLRETDPEAHGVHFLGHGISEFVSLEVPVRLELSDN